MTQEQAKVFNLSYCLLGCGMARTVRTEAWQAVPRTRQAVSLTCFLTPCSSHPWEANRFSASQEIPRIYWTPKVCYALKSARQLSLFWASSIQSMSPHPTSWRSTLILRFHLRLCLPSGLFPSGSHQSISPGPWISLWTFRNTIRFYGEELLAPTQHPSWRTNPRRLSATAYSRYSQLSFTSEAIPPSATWGRAMPWWKKPTYHGKRCHMATLNHAASVLFLEVILPMSNIIRGVKVFTSSLWNNGLIFILILKM